jgi:ATP dependent DNA ligase domain
MGERSALGSCYMGLRPSRLHPSVRPFYRLPPARGEGWIHEPKWDGFRFQVIKDGAGVRLYSKSGAEYTNRLPAVAEAFSKLPAQSAILDGELVLINPKGGAHLLVAPSWRTIISETDKGTVPLEAQLHLALEPFIQQVVQKDIREAG